MKPWLFRLLAFGSTSLAITFALACGDTPGTPIVAADEAGVDATLSVCTHGDQHYEEGASFPMGDGCNGCFCKDGKVNCTTRGCDKPVPVDSDAGTTRLSVDLAPCTIVSETVMPDQGPNFDRWTLDLQATCGIGDVRIKVVGSENAQYPQLCRRTSNAITAELVVLRSGDLGDLAYDSAHGPGTCRILAGPSAAADAGDGGTARVDLTAVVQKVGSDVIGESHSFAYVGP